MMVGTFAPKTRLSMKVSDVSGVKISIMCTCNEIVTNKKLMIVVRTCFLATHLVPVFAQLSCWRIFCEHGGLEDCG